MNFLPSEICANLRKEIFSHLGGEEVFWKDVFSQHVLPEIDQGWRLVCLRCEPCYECHCEGFKIPNPLCTSCSFGEPCRNCYLYNSDPYDIGNSCNCSQLHELASWSETMQGSDLLAKYPRYLDYIRGPEWQEHLRSNAEQAKEINRMFITSVVEEEEEQHTILARQVATTFSQIAEMYGEELANQYLAMVRVL